MDDNLEMERFIKSFDVPGSPLLSTDISYEWCR